MMRVESKRSVRSSEDAIHGFFVKQARHSDGVGVIYDESVVGYVHFNST